MTQPEVYLPTRLRSLSRIVRAESRVTTAVAKALDALAEHVKGQLNAAAMDPQVLDNRTRVWREAITEHVMPVVTDVFRQGYDSEIRTPAVVAAAPVVLPGGLPGTYGLADAKATEFLLNVENRMVGVADTLFDTIRKELETGRQAEFTIDTPAGPQKVYGESIRQLSQRVDALLDDTQRWRNRATVVARTEVIGANNAGAQAAALQNATTLGANPAQVVKEWLATSDTRTRETHAAANHQTVIGLSTPFNVGGASLQQPGDPSGPAGEVIQCRCTALYHYPGDPAYDDALSRAGGTVPDDLRGLPEAAPPLPASEEPIVASITQGLGEGKYSADKLRAQAAKIENPQALRNVEEAIRRHEADLAARASQPFSARTFNSAADTRNWADSHWGPASRYSAEEFKAVREYTGSGYGPMNTTLRNSKGKRTNKLIDAMDSAINSAPRVTEDLMLNRSTGLRQLGITKTRVSIEDLQALVGQEFVDHGYMSTSLTSRVSKLDASNNVRMSIQARPGTRGIYVSGGENTPKSQILSDYGKGENELILARGSGFRILSVRKVKDGWHVIAELIQEN